MKNITDDILKYWPVLSAVGLGLFLGIGWCIRLEMKTNDNAVLLAQHDSAIDDLDHRVLPLEKVEDLREKGLLCK